MNKIKRSLVNRFLGFLSDKPIERIPAMLDVLTMLDTKSAYTKPISVIRDALRDEKSVWRNFIGGVLDEIDARCVRKFLECFVVNGNMERNEIKHKAEKEHGCLVPWAILLDPTSACNLKCTGCWAAQYGENHNLSFETLDSICSQGKKLGIFFYIFSGGEPLVRRDDIIKLCKTHQDCYFSAFTNGALVDEDFCREMLLAANFAPAFSIEGDETATDMRRGEGAYAKVLAAMEMMRAHKLPFGYSTCYHSHNTEAVASDAFVDDMIARGCRFSWNFTYMPVGRDAKPELLATPEQREHMYRRIREIRVTKPIFAMDFWNDGEHTKGCIAAGRNYLHINAAGDVEPCAFIHYANYNINEVSLLEALKSPIFAAYRKRHPFNENHLRPCPLLDNPEMLREIIEESGAHSTDLEAPEDVGRLCSKTADIASAWAKCADRLWNAG